MAINEKTALLNTCDGQVCIAINSDSIKEKPKGVAVSNSIKLANAKDELNSLQNKIKDVRRKRIEWYKKYVYLNRMCKFFVNLITAAAMFVNILEVDDDIRDIISIIAFISTLSTWSNFDKTAMEHLTATKDLQNASDLVQRCSDRLIDIQSDGFVTQQEQKQIDNIEEELAKQLDSLSYYSHIINIVSATAQDSDVKELYGNINTIIKKYQK
jgi:hypothetical protein